MKPLLSICVPTYNRCEYLRKSIESIICQPEFQNGEVEIVISDNTSNDGTELLGKEFASKYSNIRYYKNSENIVDKNFPLALGRGSGVFRKLSNDTFIYFDGSLKYICDLIKKYESEKKQILFLNGQRKTLSGEFIDCNSFEQAAVNMGYCMGWSGAFGIWGEECDGIENDLSGCELRFWHAVKACSMINEKNSALICNKELLYVQTVKGKDLSYGLYQVFYINLLGIFKKYVDIGTLSCEAYEKIRKDSLYDFFTHQIVLWESKYSDAVYDANENTKELLFKAYENEPYWSDYMKFYKKQKTSFLIRRKIKTILKKLHIRDILVALHIKKR